jgi:hypothetical protein
MTPQPAFASDFFYRPNGLGRAGIMQFPHSPLGTIKLNFAHLHICLPAHHQISTLSHYHRAFRSAFGIIFAP